MSKRALLLGGTGAMGIYLGPALLNAGFAVDVTSRNKSSSNAAGVNFVLGNAQDDRFVESVISACRYDAIVDFMVYRTVDFQRRLKILLSGTEQYFFVSSYRVFDAGPNVTENSARLLESARDPVYLVTDEYALAKARQEDLLRESGHSNWTIVRPGITYSTGRFQLGTLEADTVLLRSGRGVPVPLPAEMLDKQTTLTWAGDVARLITELVGSERALGEDFNVVTAEHHTWRTVAAIYRDVLGTEVVGVDTEDYIRAVGGGLRQYQVRYDRLVDRVLDNRKVLEATGSAQADFVPLYQGLAAELARFVDNPVPLPVNAGLQARLDALAGTFVGLEGMSPREAMRYAVHRAPGGARLLAMAKTRVGRAK